MGAEELPGLPLREFAAWAARALPERGPVSGAELISGGLSNLTFRVRFDGGGTLILRRPPRGPVLPSAHDMGREYRVLSGLQGSAVPVARTVAYVAEPELLGAPFYLVEEVEGEVYRERAQVEALTVERRAAIGSAVVGALAAIHAVDLDATGLRDFGPGGGYLQRQLRRWGGQWDASKTRELPAMEQLRARLAEQLPTEGETTLVHGDYRLDNTIVRDERVAAVVDWELSTLGDPLADLALTLTYWSDAGATVSAGITEYPGFPTVEEFAQSYAARTGRDLGALPQYLAFAEFKLAVILEGVYARYLRGGTFGEGYARAGEAVPGLVDRALTTLPPRSGSMTHRVTKGVPNAPSTGASLDG